MIGRSFIALFFSFLLCLFCTAPNCVLAWELEMHGQFQQIFEQYSQSADTMGFFGPADVDNQFTSGRLAAVNSYLGHRLAATTASGGDGSTQYQYLDLFTDVRINPAVRFRGHYHLGEFLRGRNSGYRIGTRPGTRVCSFRRPVDHVVDQWSTAHRHGGLRKTAQGFWDGPEFPVATAGTPPLKPSCW